MWAIVGSWGGKQSVSGGITVFRISKTGVLSRVGRSDKDVLAGYLTYDPTTRTLYSVDERKTDGRGPVGPAAAIHAFAFDETVGSLTWIDSQRAPGSLPNYLDIDVVGRRLVGSCHGGFDHVERVVKRPAGEWSVEFVYDDATVALYRLEDDGRIRNVADVVVLQGHGQDPNSHPQLAGHAQASPHAHCAKLDPSRRYLAVCDKGTDLLYLFRVGERLEVASTYRFPPVTGPRHVAFTSDGRRLFVTEELTSGVASLGFDPDTAEITLLDRIPSTDGPPPRLNEPAEIRVHPNDRFVYVNNRGEDTLTWFSHDSKGLLKREGGVPVAHSDRPASGARNLVFDPSGRFLFFPDLAGDCLIVHGVDANTGTPSELSRHPVPRPASVIVVGGGEEMPDHSPDAASFRIARAGIAE